MIIINKAKHIKITLVQDTSSGLNFARNMCCPHHIDSHDHTTYMNPKCSNPSIIIFHFVENKW